MCFSYPWTIHGDHNFLLYFIIGVSLLYDVVLVSAVNKVNQLYVYIDPFPLDLPSCPHIPPISVITEHEAELLVIYYSFPIATDFTRDGVYMSGLLSRFVPPALSHPVSTCPFPMSVSLFLPSGAITYSSPWLGIQTVLGKSLVNGNQQKYELPPPPHPSVLLPQYEQSQELGLQLPWLRSLPPVSLDSDSRLLAKAADLSRKGLCM